MFTPFLIALDRGCNGIQKILVAKRLGEEIETAQSRQPDVEYEAAWNIRALALQELLRRCEYLDPQLYRLKEPRKRLTHGGVVVHDKDDRLVRAANGLR